ncbi:PAS domain S-box protein [bacterium]|nr:PAS domain S-box protein [bacterium]
MASVVGDEFSLEDSDHKNPLLIESPDENSTDHLLSLVSAMNQHATMAMTDFEGRILYVNNKFCEISGYGRAELLGKNPRILNSGYHPREFFSELWDTVKSGRTWHGEIRNKTKEGTFYWTKTTIVPVPHGKERYRFIAVLTDISERVHAQALLAETNDTLNALIQASPLAILGIDAGGTITLWNTAARQMLGLDGCIDGVRLVPDDILVGSDSIQKIIESTLKGHQIMDQKVKIRTRNEEILDVSLHAAPLFEEPNRVSGAVFVLNDITQQLRTEREVLEISERDQLRVGLDLHDVLGQDLLAIALKSKILEERLREGGRPEADELQQIATSISETVGKVREFARCLTLVRLDEEGIYQALRHFSKTITEVFEIRCRFECDASDEPTDSTLVNHLFRIAQEATRNAAKHSGGTEICIQLKSKNNQWFLQVSDDGNGFCSKQKSKGLGLSVMRYRTNLLGGRLDVLSMGPKGTRIVCEVPIH